MGEKTLALDSFRMGTNMYLVPKGELHSLVGRHIDNFSLVYKRDPSKDRVLGNGMADTAFDAIEDPSELEKISRNYLDTIAQNN